MIETELKIKCESCKEYGSLSKTSRVYTKYEDEVRIEKAYKASLINSYDASSYLCSLGCLIKFIASEADNDRL